MAITLNQTRFLQPLRNSNILANYDAAVAALKEFASSISSDATTKSKADGTKVVARYFAGSENVVKSIFGIYEQAKSSMTIYAADLDKISEIEVKIANAESAAKAAATKLTKPEGEKFLQLSSVTGENGEITYTLSTLDVASAKALEEEIARAKAAEKVNADAIAAEKQRAEAAEQANAAAIAAEAAARDNADKALKAELLGDAAEGYNTLGKLEDQIQSAIAAAKSYSLNKLDANGMKELSETNVREAYKLVDEDGVQVGDTIKIYKDSSLKKVELSGQTLQFTYILADGSESVVGVDVSSFLAESEFGHGLQVIDHVVSVKIAEGSESFLTVDANGVKLSGVQSAIDAAKAAAEQTATAAIAAEEKRALAAEKVNADAIAAEKDRALAAEKVNADAIAAEKQRAEAAEKVNADAIAAEKQRAEAAEAAATTKVVATKTNEMLTVIPVENADHSFTYNVDLSDVWDCGTFTV